MAETPLVSIVIPSYQREKDLACCLQSLEIQNGNKEIIILKEKGPLAKIRNEGLRKARGRYVTFIDDDTVCQPGWLESIIKLFVHPNVIGVSGPAFIPEIYRNNRDIFRFKWASKLYREHFAGGQGLSPGHFSKAGAPSLASAYKENKYQGPVQYLEACNMSFRTQQIKSIGGFDEKYTGVGEWSEPDLCFRLRKKFNGFLWYSQRAALSHYPSKQGPYKFRKKTKSRMQNYELFSSRWLDQNIDHKMYKIFMRGYYTWKKI